MLNLSKHCTWGKPTKNNTSKSQKEPLESGGNNHEDFKKVKKVEVYDLAQKYRINQSDGGS